MRVVPKLKMCLAKQSQLHGGSHMTEADLQNWTKALRLVLLVQPSSAPAESFFPNFINSFQESSLEDYIVFNAPIQ